MEIYDEWNLTIDYHISSNELLTILDRMKVRNEQEIQAIKDKINQYEQKKKSEEAFYQSLSPVRKFFAGRTPNHHQAVEYKVHVKERMKKISKLKQRVFHLDKAIRQLNEDSSKQELVLPNPIFEEVIRIKEKGDYES